MLAGLNPGFSWSEVTQLQRFRTEESLSEIRSKQVCRALPLSYRGPEGPRVGVEPTSRLCIRSNSFLRFAKTQDVKMPCRE